MINFITFLTWHVPVGLAILIDDYAKDGKPEKNAVLTMTHLQCQLLCLVMCQVKLQNIAS